MLLGFDLDFSRLDALVKQGIIRTRLKNGGEQFNAHDVLSVSGRDLNKTLDKHLPIDRHNRDIPRKEFRVLETETARQCFRRQWSRLHRHIARLIADPEEDIGSRELRLLHQLMEASRFYSRFDLAFTGEELRRVTGLDDEYLPKARRRLEHLGLLLKQEKTGNRLLTLLDPKTGEVFDDCAGEASVPILPVSAWDSWEE
jgi:hypothetical protein